MAAETHVDHSIENPSVFIETNIHGTHNLLQAARATDVKKFIHISTDEVYGDLSSTAPAFKEDHNILPNSPYSASKASSDLLVRSYMKTYGFPACITRASNNYGPHQDTSKLIPKVIKHALKNKKIPIYARGENVRDWLFVKDHVGGIFAVLEEGIAGEVYNIGGNNEQKNIDIVNSILSILGKSASLIEYVDDRPGHDFRYALDSSKIMTNLNWSPQEDFEELLGLTISWYKDIL